MSEIRKIEDREDLVTADKALALYEQQRVGMAYPEEAKISHRTFRFWCTKGLFMPLIRGKYNRAYYPKTIVDDMGVIRICQISYGLTIDQIKELFFGIKFGYFKTLSLLESDGSGKVFQSYLSSDDPNKISKARELLLKNIPATYVTKTRSKTMKQIANIYKEMNDDFVNDLLSKTGDELFLKAVSEYETLHDNDNDIICQVRAQFITTILYFVAKVREGSMTPNECLERIKRVKQLDYKIAIVLVKKHEAYMEIMRHEK